MKMHATALLFLLLAACARPGDTAASAEAAAPAATPATAAVPAPTSTSLVLAEPLPGWRVKVSITARDTPLSITNCNQHVVVALMREGSDVPIWGGESDACLSPAVIVPAQATLSVIVDIDASATGVDTATPYRAHVFGVLQGAQPDAPPVPHAQATSQPFQLLP